MLENIKKCLKTNETLQEMIFFMPVYGLLCQLTIVWFVEDKPAYSIGLWMGILLAAAMATHMAYALDIALDYDSEVAQKIITKQSMIRYAVLVVICALIMVSGFANPLSAFLGIMSLKVSAYMQPLTHKLIRR